METGNLGFMIPSIYDIIEFMVFRAIPVTTLALLALSGGIRYKTHDKTNPLYYANGVVALILISLYASVSGFNFVSGLLFVAIFIVIFLTVCSFFVKIFYLLYDRKKSYALTYILIIIALYVFFYPKDQNWYRNEEERLVPAVSCECIGFSEEGIYSSEYGFFEARCFGIPVQCRESMKDRCPFLPPDEDCITVDASDLS
ncbi:hypothetical protein IPM65_04480 [Candidatus Roizmanbacteria bacterium]|nr:MAG: hypothetical protein IPM65_04480 [Candidatus Roizmanbacteria bacterium]